MQRTETEYLIDQSLRVMMSALDLIQFEVRSGTKSRQIAELAEAINCVPGVVRIAGCPPTLSEQGKNQLRWAIDVANQIMREMERSGPDPKPKMVERLKSAWNLMTQ